MSGTEGFDVPIYLGVYTDDVFEPSSRLTGRADREAVSLVVGTAYQPQTHQNVLEMIAALNRPLNSVWADAQVLVDNVCVADADGIFLDYYGLVLAEARGGREDEEYRAALLAKASGRATGGTIIDNYNAVAINARADNADVWEHNSNDGGALVIETDGFSVSAVDSIIRAQRAAGLDKSHAALTFGLDVARCSAGLGEGVLASTSGTVDVDGNNMLLYGIQPSEGWKLAGVVFSEKAAVIGGRRYATGISLTAGGHIGGNPLAGGVDER